MNLDNSTVLITGANRGMGLVFARAALARGARKVNAGARDPMRLTLPGVTPIRLDENSPDDIAAAWSRSNGLRHALRGQETQVPTLHTPSVDIDGTQGVAMPESMPEAIVAKAFGALEAGADEEMIRNVKFGLPARPGVYPQALE